MVKGVILASVPPVKIMSASPYLINLSAMPIASLDEAQAEITVWLGPRNPNFIERWPPAILGIIFATNCGDTLLGPLLLIVSCSFSSV